MAEWLEPRDVDILCLQEVRAPDAIVRELLGEGWYILHAEAEAKGRAGVAIASREEPHRHPRRDRRRHFATAGRWVEADYDVRTPTARPRVTVVSAYVHSGEAGTPKQVDKYRFLDAMASGCPSWPSTATMPSSSATSTSATASSTSRTGRATSSAPASCPRSAPTSTASSARRRLTTRIGCSRAHWPGEVDGPVHLVVAARPGLRQRHRMAHRLPAGHARARCAAVSAASTGQRPGTAMVRPRPVVVDYRL